MIIFKKRILWIPVSYKWVEILDLPWHALKVKVKLLSRVRVFATLLTVAYQAPQSMGFSRQEYWRGLPFPSPGDIPNPGIEHSSPTLQVDSLPAEPQGKPPDSSVGKKPTCNSGDPGSIPGLGWSTGEVIGYPLQYSWASLVAQLVKNLPAMWETWVWSLRWKDTLEKGKATHSSFPTWRIPWTVDTTLWLSLPKLFEVHVTDKKCMFFRCTMWCFDVCVPCEIITTVNLTNISIALYSYDFYLCGENT